MTWVRNLAARLRNESTLQRDMERILITMERKRSVRWTAGELFKAAGIESYRPGLAALSALVEKGQVICVHNNDMRIYFLSEGDAARSIT